VSKLESVLQSDSPIDPDLLSEAETLLADVMQGIGAWCECRAQSESATPVGDIQAATVLIARMRELLEDSNGDAVDLIDDLNIALVGSECADHLSALRQHLSAYDFDAALADLDVMVSLCQADSSN